MYHLYWLSEQLASQFLSSLEALIKTKQPYWVGTKLVYIRPIAVD